VNSGLVVLSSQLANAQALLKEACSARAGAARSSLTSGGRGGLPADPVAALPGLYIADRPVSETADAGIGGRSSQTARAPIPITVNIQTSCSG